LIWVGEDYIRLGHEKTNFVDGRLKCMSDFDAWNELKKNTEAGNAIPDKYPKEGEVWMSSLGRNIGYEQNGGGDNLLPARARD